MVSDVFLQRARRALLACRTPDGHWEGRLSSSALATATAVAALAVSARAGVSVPGSERLVRDGIRWLQATENAGGGWGDTEDSVSNLSTTALVWAALAFAGDAASTRASERTAGWIARAAGGPGPEQLAQALARRYGRDRTFSVPILTMCAIAGRLGADERAWRLIPRLPFELAVLPRRSFGALRLPVVSYALPALIAMGLARHTRGPSSPVHGWRDLARPRVLRVLERLQPPGGGFLEAVPLTSFVAMSLVAAGEEKHPVVARALEFLARSVRGDGSWPIDSNLATWGTTLAVGALAECGMDEALTGSDRDRLVGWLLRQQWRAEHPYTGAAPGGWAWTDLPGGVPDADDTAGALVALAALAPDDPAVRVAACGGIGWLLDLQNRDGGMPTFCRGWGTLPFDRSATDLTAHAIRAWTAWRGRTTEALDRRTGKAIAAALRYLHRSQRADGAFVPLWFGNQAAPDEENPVFGTARVMRGLAAARRGGQERAAEPYGRAAHWLWNAQNEDGGWGAGSGVASSVEETAVAIAGLADRWPGAPPLPVERLRRGVEWLERATASGTQFPASPLGLYFARLWYAEELYPLVFTTAALGSVGRLTAGSAA